MKTILTIMLPLFFVAVSSSGRNAFSEINVPDSWREINAFVESTPEPVPATEDIKAGFIPFSRNYVDPVYKNTRPRVKEIADHFHVILARGEFEPFIVALYALKDLKHIRIRFRDVVSQNNKIPEDRFEVRTVEYRAVRPRGHRERDRVFQLVPSLLRPGNHADVKKGETTAFWVTVHALRSQAPGDYSGRIVVLINKRPIRVLGLRITVLPFVLKEIPGRTFAALYTPLSAGIERNARVLMEDMRAHGMTAYAPVVRAWGKPLSFDRDGRPKVPGLVRHLQWAREEGFREPTILNVQKLIRAGRPGLDASYDKFEEKIDVPNLRKMIGFLEKERKKYNLPEIIYLPIDEPGCFTDRAGSRREEMAVLLLKTIQNLNVRGATTIADLVDNKHRRIPRWKNVAGWWDRIRPYCSVRIYANGFPQGVTALEKEIKDAWARGHEVMLYENTSTMGTDPRVSRMYYGFYGWRRGVAGLTSWTYLLLGLATTGHAWADRRERRKALRRYYEDPRWEPKTTTVCWEMVREGIDDARYIYAFQEAVRKNPSRARAYRALLKEIGRDVDRTGMNRKRARCGWQGKRFAGYRLKLIRGLMDMKGIFHR